MSDLKQIERLLRSAAKIAKRRGLGNLPFTYRDLGDLYHVYGVNASGAKLVDMLERRQRAALENCGSVRPRRA
jgi:hypothetical protein